MTTRTRPARLSLASYAVSVVRLASVIWPLGFVVLGILGMVCK